MNYFINPLRYRTAPPQRKIPRPPVIISLSRSHIYNYWQVIYIVREQLLNKYLLRQYQATHSLTRSCLTLHDPAIEGGKLQYALPLPLPLPICKIRAFTLNFCSSYTLVLQRRTRQHHGRDAATTTTLHFINNSRVQYYCITIILVVIDTLLVYCIDHHLILIQASNLFCGQRQHSSIA